MIKNGVYVLFCSLYEHHILTRCWHSSLNMMFIQLTIFYHILLFNTHTVVNYQRPSFSRHCRRVGNSLPQRVTSAASLSVFRRHLKARL